MIVGKGRRESEINVIYIDDRQELMCVLFLAGAKKASSITCSLNITDGVFKLPNISRWPIR